MRRCGAGLRLLHEKRCPDGFPFIPGAALTHPGSLGPAAKPARYPRSRNTPYVLEQPAQSLGGLHHALAAAGRTAGVLAGRDGDSNHAARTAALDPPACPAALAARHGHIRLSLRLAPEGTAGAVGRRD